MAECKCVEYKRFTQNFNLFTIIYKLKIKLKVHKQ